MGALINNHKKNPYQLNRTVPLHVWSLHSSSNLLKIVWHHTEPPNLSIVITARADTKVSNNVICVACLKIKVNNLKFLNVELNCVICKDYFCIRPTCNTAASRFVWKRMCEKNDTYNLYVQCVLPLIVVECFLVLNWPDERNQKAINNTNNAWNSDVFEKSEMQHEYTLPKQYVLYHQHSTL